MTEDVCERCESATQLVEHHTSYEDDETVTLCRSCHGAVHVDPHSPYYPEDEPVKDHRDANVYLTDEQIVKLDEHVEAGRYPSRSEAVRVAVDRLLEKQQPAGVEA